jgi:2'-5' RNA ligase
VTPIDSDRPTGKTALVIIPPPDVCGFVDGYRQIYMPDMMHIVPPNVTITDNFVPYEEVEEAIARLKNVFQYRKCFPLALRGFATFPDQGVLCLYLSHPERVIALYKAIVAEFPDSRAYGGKYGDDLTPHMTVGIFADKDELFRVHKELEDQRLFISWDVESIAVLYQVEGGEWRHWTDVPLWNPDAPSPSSDEEQ